MPTVPPHFLHTGSSVHNATSLQTNCAIIGNLLGPWYGNPWALLPHPVNQFPVDMAHGVVNILFTMVLSLCSHLLQTYKGLCKKETTELFDSLVCGRDDLIEEP